MARYIAFKAADGGEVLVEVEEGEGSALEGVRDAGIRDRLEVALDQAKSSFEDAIGTAVRQNVEAFIDVVQSLDRRPSTVEISFGLKATGEAGNLAVGKVGGEVNYTVKLAWELGGSGDR